MRHWFVQISLLVGLSLSQVVAAADDVGHQIEQALMLRSHDALRALVPGGRYTLSIDVTAKTTPSVPQKSWYLRGKTGQLRSGNFAELGKSALVALTERIDLTIGLPPQLAKAEQKEIELILRSSLALRPTDKLQWKSLQLLRPDTPNKAADEQLQRVESELRDTKKQLETMLETSKQPAAPLTLEATLKSQAAMLLGYLVLFVALIFLSLGIRQIGSRLGQAVQVLAGSVQNAAESLASAQRSAVAAVPELTSSAPARLTDAGQSVTPAPNNEASAEQVALLKKDLSEILADNNPKSLTSVSRYIIDGLATPASIGKSMVVFELLGRERAATLFETFAEADKAKIVEFIRAGVYPRQKHELMMQVGEELKSKIMLETIAAPTSAETNAVLQLIKVQTKDDLVALIAALPPPALPRLFSMLDAQLTAAVFAAMKQAQLPNYEACAAALLSLPDSKSANGPALQFDAVILETMQNLRQSSRMEVFKPLLKHYEEIMEALPDDQSDEVLSFLAPEPELARHLSSSLISLSTLFKLVESQIEDVLNQFSIKELAALTFGMVDQQRDVVYKLTDQAKLELLREELGRLEAGGKAKAERAFKAARARVVQNLKLMKANGELQFASDQSSPLDSLRHAA